MLMNGGEKMRQYSADKIFLFGLFVLALAAAYIVVVARSAIVLGEPVEIPAVGISVRLPSGNGWEADKTWQHEGDGLVLRSVLRPDQSRLAHVACTYQLAAGRTSARQWLRQQAADISGTAYEYGTEHTPQADLEWVHIGQTAHMVSAMVATAALGHGRWLDIEIMQDAAGDETLRKVFGKVAQSITLGNDELLERGIKIMGQVRDDGLDKVMAGLPQSYYYLAKNPGRQEPIGFVVDMLLIPPNTDKTEVQAGGFAYITTPERWETAMVFKSAADLNSLIWESESDETRTFGIRRGPLVIRGPQHVRTSTRLSIIDGNEMSVESIRPEPTQSQATISEAAVPNAVVEAVYARMLRSNTNEVLVDVVEPDGQVNLALISMTPNPPDEPQAATLIETKYIGSEQTERAYLDSEMRVIKRIVKQNATFVLEPVGMEELTRRFPERADYILQRSRALREGRL
jgi:hypothetical protein